MIFQTRAPAIGKTVVTAAMGKQPASGLVYFLHGACDSGLGIQEWVHKIVDGHFAFRNFPVMYPTSPTLSYTLHGGKKQSIWFDQVALNPNMPEDLGNISAVGSQLKSLIEKGEKETGIPIENVIIGGFSMGGAMAIHMGYGLLPNVAGVFAISSFIPTDSRLYEDMELQTAMLSPAIKFDKKNRPIDYSPAQSKFPKLFMSHGKQDPIVPIRWAKTTFNDLRKRGADGHFYTIENGQHSLNKNQMGLLHNWVTEILLDKISTNDPAQNSKSGSPNQKPNLSA